MSSKNKKKSSSKLDRFEYFDPKYCHKSIQLTKKNCVATTNGKEFACVLLQKIVKSGVHQWKFLLLKATGYQFCIGVIKTDSSKYQIDDYDLSKYLNDNSYLNNSYFKGKAYGISDLSETTCGDDNNTRTMEWGGTKVKQGDTIEMTLDLNKMELKFKLGTRNYGVVFKNIEKVAYRAIISGVKQGLQFKILSYKQLGINKKKGRPQFNQKQMSKTKCNNCDKLVMEMKELQVGQGIVVGNLKEQVVFLKKKNAKLNELNSKLNEECKEMTYELNELKDIKNKYDRLIRKMNINEKEFMKWDCDTVCDWILSLNKEYEKYAQKLRENLKNEEVVGALLTELGKDDLHRFGIVLLKHKIDVMKHIKRIISQTNDTLTEEGN